MLKKYTLRIDEESMEKLRYIADNSFRSVNKELEVIIGEHISRYEKTNGVIKLRPK